MITNKAKCSRTMKSKIFPCWASVMLACGSGLDGKRPPDSKPTKVAQALVHSLSENRNRLFSDLAARKGTSTCDLWSRMIESERYTFLVQTAVFGSWQSYLYAPTPHFTYTGSCDNPSSNCDNGCNVWIEPVGRCLFVSGWECLNQGQCYQTFTQDYFETLLDQATSLFSINGPTDGCGGFDYNRIYLGFDSVGTWAIRNWTAAGGIWRSSNDPAGPHDPFTSRQDIYWDSCFTINNGPTRHHWAYDSERTSLCGRLGVGIVTDPSIVEITTSYSCLHDANPTCQYGGRFGYQIAEDKLGPGSGQYGWQPDGCSSPPATINTYAGMGQGC